MRRAPTGVGLLLGLALALLITLVGPLALFNPWFTSVLQQRHDVAAAFDAGQDEVDRVTGELLADVWLGGTFDAAVEPGEPLLDGRERSHMHDVSVLVRTLVGVILLSAVIATACIGWLRHDRRRLGAIVVVAAGTVGTLAIVVAGAFALAFDAAFVAFHEIFFPPGTWTFETGSNLITLFPQGFWFDAALAAGATILLSAVILSLVGLGVWRGAATTVRRA